MKIGFIGCGNMASAMISGMLKKGLYKKDEIIVSNLTEEGSKRSREKLGVVTTLDNHEVVKNTKLVFLAVKPQFYEEVLNEVKDELRSGAICEANAFINVVRGRADLRGRTNADVQE